MIQIHSGRKELVHQITKVTLVSASVFASWLFAMSAVWGVGPFSWPADTPEPTIIAENITVDTVSEDTSARPVSSATVTTASATR